MANELSLTFGLSFSKSGITEALNPGLKLFNVAGSNFMRQTQTIGTSAEAIALGDVATPGYILMHNLNVTNYVEVFNDNGATKPVVHLRPGGWALFEFAITASAPFAKADTGSCIVEYVLIEL